MVPSLQFKFNLSSFGLNVALLLPCVVLSSFSILIVHHLDIMSRHHHENKWNRFIVLEGKLKITIYKGDRSDETILTEGMFSDVPPEIDHRFEALEDTKALEVYWVDGLDPTDIVRKDSGGINRET